MGQPVCPAKLFEADQIHVPMPLDQEQVSWEGVGVVLEGFLGGGGRVGWFQIRDRGGPGIRRWRTMGPCLGHGVGEVEIFAAIDASSWIRFLENPGPKGMGGCRSGCFFGWWGAARVFSA